MCPIGELGGWYMLDGAYAVLPGEESLDRVKRVALSAMSLHCQRDAARQLVQKNCRLG